MEILQSSWQIGQPIRLLTVTAINLVDAAAAEQMSFLGGSAQDRARAERMERTMDEVRKKYGTSAIGFGAVLQNDIGAAVRGDLLESESIKQKKRR